MLFLFMLSKVDLFATIGICGREVGMGVLVLRFSNASQK